MAKYIYIDFSACNPQECNCESGECIAVRSCSHKLLLQEDAFDSPMLISEKLCRACGKCVVACPLGAIRG